MPTYYGAAVNGKQARMDVSWTQSVAGNYSNVRQVLYVLCDVWVADSNMQVAQSMDGVSTYWWSGYARFEAGTSVVSDVTNRADHNAQGQRSVTLVGSIYAGITGLVNVSVTVTTLTLPTIPRQPSAPSRPWADSITHNSMVVKFSAQGGIAATKYELQRSTSSNFSNPTTVSSSGTSTITGLTPGTTYYYRARSGNAAGWSGWGPTLTTYTTPQANRPTIGSVTATSMVVSFGRTGGTAGSASWELQRSTDADFKGGLVTISSSGAATTISGLTPGTRYYFRARGKNNSGTGPWSASASDTTSGLLAPGIAVTSTDTGAAAIVTLTAPSGATISSYVIEAEYLSPLPKPGGADKSVSTKTLINTVSGLRPGARYRWRAKALVGTYSTAWSDWVTRIQLNPNTLDEEYFDSTMTSTDPDVIRTTETINGAVISVETVSTPKYWRLTGDRTTLRRFPENLVPSDGSLTSARVKVIRDLASVSATPQYLRLLGAGDAPIAALPSATHTAHVTFLTTGAVTLAFNLIWHDAAGDPLHQEFRHMINPATGVPHEVTILGKSPVDTAGVSIEIIISSAAHGTVIDFDGGFIGLGRLPYFDGGTPNTPRFVHAWAGTKWDSESTRTRVAAPIEVDPFADPTCPAPPAPPRPPVPKNECLPEVATWRRYFSPVSADAVSSSLESLPTFTITTGQLPDGPVRVQIFENPLGTAPEDFVPDSPISEQVVTYLPANSEVVLDAVSERSNGRLLPDGSFSSVDHLVYGAAGGPTSWPVLGCGQPYMIVIDVPASSPLGNVVLTASLTNRMG